MKLEKSSTALFVRDIGISKDFYCHVLGLPVDLDFGGNVIFRAGFAIWEIRKDHVISSLPGLEKISEPASNRFELYFETEDLQSDFDWLKSRNVRFLHDIHEEPWGQRTIRFFDPDGHLIEIGESMRQFVRRFYEKGMTFEQVSRRTSVPVEEVRRLINQE